MSNIQSFLNATGLSYLWEKITNKFVDKENLTTVVNAIDDVKLDKAELVNISDLIIDKEKFSKPYFLNALYRGLSYLSDL